MKKTIFSPIFSSKASQKSKLRLTLNIPYPDIIDPKGLCHDISSLGRWCNGDVDVGLFNMNEIDDVMELFNSTSFL